jgi:hypothetical protein
VKIHVETADEDARNVRMSTSVDRELDRLRCDAGDWAGVTVQGRTEGSTDAAQTIIDCAVGQRADLVVLGTRGSGWTTWRD